MTQDVEDCNAVRLVGRVSSTPVAKELPSGDVVLLFRLVVRRPEGHASRQSVDVLECSVWAPRLQRTMGSWREGDQVEVEGAVRRRFYRAGQATASRVEVEVSRGRLRRRADAA